jgi:membrane protease YdiL (CAAX protease family)
MNLTYIFLIITIAISLFYKNRSVLYGLTFVTIIIAYLQNVLGFYSLISIVVFSSIAYFFYHYKHHTSFTKYISLLLLIFGCFAFILHVVPGINNFKIFANVKLSENSCPYNMWLNFDKAIIALIIYIVGDFYIVRNKIKISELKITALSLISCSALLIVLVLFLEHVQFELKFPKETFIWILNNFFIVAFAEEVIFRGVIQRQLTTIIPPKLVIIISSIIFGIMHYTGGVDLIFLASIAGLFYGYTYLKTNRIIFPMIVHFGVNFTHYLLFTYPASLSVCQ